MCRKQGQVDICVNCRNQANYYTLPNNQCNWVAGGSRKGFPGYRQAVQTHENQLAMPEQISQSQRVVMCDTCNRQPRGGSSGSRVSTLPKYSNPPSYSSR